MKIRTGFVSNSSSEAFVCNSGHSIKETKIILQEIITFYNKMFEEDLDFYDVFEDPKIVTKEDIDMLKDYGHKAKPEDYTSVIIYSAGSNSVPYTMFDIIDKKFDSWKVHLG